jgi:hypothetical protein
MRWHSNCSHDWDTNEVDRSFTNRRSFGNHYGREMTIAVLQMERHHVDYPNDRAYFVIARLVAEMALQRGLGVLSQRRLGADCGYPIDLAAYGKNLGQ